MTFAIAMLDELIELAGTIHRVWAKSHESNPARKVAGRCVEDLQGEMPEGEIASCHIYYIKQPRVDERR